MILKIKYIFLFQLIFLSCFVSFGQNKTIDSLEMVLKTVKSDTGRIKTLNQLSEQFWLKGEYSIAGKYANEALALCEESLLTASGKAKVTLLNEKANSYNYIAIIYRFLGDYPLALKNHFIALKIREETANKKGIARSYLGIGSIYRFMGKYTEAMKNYLSALHEYQLTEDKNGIANSYNHIGIVYNEQGNYAEAMKNNKTSLKFWQETGFKNGIADALMEIGLVNSEQGNYDDALKNYFEGLKIRTELGDQDGISECYIYIGEVDMKLKKNEEAQQYFHNALILSKKIGSKVHLKELYSLLSKLDSIKGDYPASYQDYKMYILYKDSLVNQKAAGQVTQMQMQFEVDKKDAIAIEEKQKQKIITLSIVAGLLLVMLFAGFMFNRWRITQRQKKAIDEAYLKLDEKNRLIEEKNKDILDSLRYAKRIQTALLPTEKFIDRILSDNDKSTEA